MKYANVEGQRLEAKPGLSGVCPGCGQSMVARCGEVNIWHWAHMGRRVCDRWWESETKWHRNWKNRFPPDWQEIVHPAENGERHIADVRTKLAWVIEFQHSRIDPEERHARDMFYKKLVWVVDGTRRKLDQAQFFQAYECSHALDGAWTISPRYAEECTLLKEWSGSAPVFLDFGEVGGFWWLVRRKPNGSCVVREINRAEFVNRLLCEDSASAANFAALLASMREPSAPANVPGNAALPHPKQLTPYDVWHAQQMARRRGGGSRL